MFHKFEAAMIADPTRINALMAKRREAVRSTMEKATFSWGKPKKVKDQGVSTHCFIYSTLHQIEVTLNTVIEEKGTQPGYIPEAWVFDPAPLVKALDSTTGGKAGDVLKHIDVYGLKAVGSDASLEFGIFYETINLTCSTKLRNTDYLKLLITCFGSINVGISASSHWKQYGVHFKSVNDYYTPCRKEIAKVERPKNAVATFAPTHNMTANGWVEKQGTTYFQFISSYGNSWGNNGSILMAIDTDPRLLDFVVLTGVECKQSSIHRRGASLWDEFQSEYAERILKYRVEDSQPSFGKPKECSCYVCKKSE